MMKLKFLLFFIALGFLLTILNVQSNAQEMPAKEKMKFLIILDYTASRNREGVNAKVVTEIDDALNWLAK